MVMNGWQFGRYAEVIIKDFNKNVRTVVGNDFEIEFEFFKSVDDSKQNSTGAIRIKGLSEERCEQFSESGGEVTLRCGYQDNIETLFVAYIMRMYKEIRDNTTVMTIECSMNVQEFFYSSGVEATPNSKGVEYRSPLNIMLKNYAENLGYVRVDFYTDGTFTKEEQAKAYEIYNKGIVSFQFEGTASEQLNMMCTAIHVSRNNIPTDDGLVLQLVAKQGFLDRLGQVELISDEESKKYYKDYVDFRGMYQATQSDGFGTLTTLSTTTGLLSTQVEYKIAKAYRDQELMSDSEETLQSKEKTAKFYENEKKRKADGKKELKAVKGFKAKTVRNEIQVRRRYLKLTALLNPKVRPQSPLMVIHKVYNEQGQVEFKSDVGRARDVSYKGNNKTGDWTMEVYLETNAENDIELSPDEIKALARNDELANQTYSKPPSQSFSGNYKYNYPDNMKYDQVKNLGFRTPIQNSKGDHYEPLSGGGTKGATLEFAKVLDDDGLDGNMKRFTAFNDGYHIGRKSVHNTGKAFDLALNTRDVNTVARVRQDIINKGAETGYILKVTAEHPQGAKMGLTGFKWYPHSTGVHVHVEVLGKK